MKQKKILIVEDNIITAKHIASTLKKSDFEIQGIHHSFESAIQALQSEVPDLVLLDINLGGTMDGVHLASVLNTDFKIPFIFLTSYSDEKTMNRILSVKAAGYVIKPFNPINLKSTIDRAFGPFSSQELPVLQVDQKSKAQKNEFLFIRNNRNIEKILIQDIEFIESDGRYSFTWVNNIKKISNTPLKVFKEKLSSQGFIQTHKSYLVNLSKINSITVDSVIINGHEIPIGRNFKDDLMKSLQIV